MLVETTENKKLKNAFQDVKAAIEEYTAQYDANVNLAQSAETPQVSWKWAYEGNDDVKDTALGNAANATINFNLVITVTQID